MGITVSSRSPAMAYSEGGLWVNTYDEAGRRCWVHQRSGQRTYQFIRGKPVTPTISPFPVQYQEQQHWSPMAGPCPAPWGYTGTLQSTAPPAPGYFAPPVPAGCGGGGGGVAMVPYQAGYGPGAPPVAPTGNGVLQHLQRTYLRPSSERSWMWK
ncbi:unnamed protein product [Pylaiella littoralis]